MYALLQPSTERFLFAATKIYLAYEEA